MKTRTILKRNHIISLFLLIAVTVCVNYVIAYGGDSPQVLGHTPGEIAPGTFAGNGDYIFPGTSNLIVNGNVGIGTTDPAAELDVNGGIAFNGQKVCGCNIEQNGLWTQFIFVVPNTWSKETCRNTCKSLLSGWTTLYVHCACLFYDSWSLSTIGETPSGTFIDDTPPEPNCGW